jgi:hypothetical protein
MKIKFDTQDNKLLKDQGYVMMDAGNDELPLLIITPAYMQILADNFAAGHAIQFGKFQILANSAAIICPDEQYHHSPIKSLS